MKSSLLQQEAVIPKQLSVPFHGSNLVIVEHEGEPYTSMKPIVEGMGMSWGTQARKLRANSERWGMFLMNIPSIDPHNTICRIPLRKLFGWLQTLQPNRVRKEIRDKVIQYQNECDDVLWRFWNYETNQLPTSTPSRVTTKLLMTLENGRVIGTVPVGDDVMVFERSMFPGLVSRSDYFSIKNYVD
ncbi:phage antirepressor N-terminal domain-containing protein [Vibrio splendidus]|uniref:phage antirepressor N-terminal domain-containing protein n=1 Tax=Vibrio splendidus TaxID=29497 RepID=UPI0021BDC8A4|nr:phage antirepressor N-terminal domain-containing protein [Vibrio splendidus]